MENVTNVTFSDRLKSLMASRNLNNARVSEAVGLSHVAIGHYVRGDRMPGAIELYKLAKFFGVRMEWFIEGEIEAVETVERATAASEAIVETSQLPEAEKQAAFNNLLERFQNLERATIELRELIARINPSMVIIQGAGATPAAPTVSSASDVAGAKLLKKGAASVPGPSPKSSRSRGAASPTSQTSSPKRGADKE